MIAKHNSPAPTGASQGTGAGESFPSRPRSPLTKGEEASLELDAITGSNDVVWLRRIAGDADKSLGERRAAERRLRILRKAHKKK